MKQFFLFTNLFILLLGCQKASLSPLDLKKNPISGLQIYRPTLNTGAVATLATEGWTVTTLAGGLSGDADGIGSAAKIKPNRPSAFILGNNYYFSDFSNSKIKKIDLTNNTVSLAFNTSTLNPSGLLYYNNKVYYIAGSSFVITDLNGSNQTSSSVYFSSNTASMGIVPLKENATYNIITSPIEAATNCGVYYSQLGNSGLFSVTSIVDANCSSPSDGSFTTPLALPKTGNVVAIIPSNYTTKPKYIYVCGLNMVMRFEASVYGSGTIIAGNINATTTVNGNGKSAVFESIGGCVLSGKDLYIAQSGSIRRLDLTTNEVTTLAGTFVSQSSLTSGSDGTGSGATLCNASALAVYNNSLIFIDTCKSGSSVVSATIRKITPPTGRTVFASAFNEEASSFTNSYTNQSCNWANNICADYYTAAPSNGATLPSTCPTNFTMTNTACTSTNLVLTCTCRLVATNEITTKAYYYSPSYSVGTATTACSATNTNYSNAGIGITCN